MTEKILRSRIRSISEILARACSKVRRIPHPSNPAKLATIRSLLWDFKNNFPMLPVPYQPEKTDEVAVVKKEVDELNDNSVLNLNEKYTIILSYFKFGISFVFILCLFYCAIQVASQMVTDCCVFIGECL